MTMVLIINSMYYCRINRRLARVEMLLNQDRAEQKGPPKGYVLMRLKVTAYSSDRNQCDSDPYTGAWNNRVRQGMVAVSRDLEQFGITNGIPVAPYMSELSANSQTRLIDRLWKMGMVFLASPQGHMVLDRMHPRKHQQLDVWMPQRGLAEMWGVQYHDVLVPIEHVRVKRLAGEYGVRVVL